MKGSLLALFLSSAPLAKPSSHEQSIETQLVLAHLATFESVPMISQQAASPLRVSADTLAFGEKTPIFPYATQAGTANLTCDVYRDAATTYTIVDEPDLCLATIATHATCLSGAVWTGSTCFRRIRFASYPAIQTWRSDT